jgi:hypothetical protein
MRGIANCAVLLVSLAACGKVSAVAEGLKTVTDARKLVDLGQCEAAVTKLRDFTSSSPDSFDGFFALGDALTCTCFDPSETRAPHRPKDGAKCTEALAAYESAIRLKKDAPAALTSAGALTLVLGDRKAARKYLEAATTADPESDAAANLLAIASWRNDENQALERLTRHYAGRRSASIAGPTIEVLCGGGSPCSIVLLESVTQPAASLQADGSDTAKAQNDSPPSDEEETSEGTGGIGAKAAGNQGKMGKKESQRSRSQQKMKSEKAASDTSSRLRTYAVGTVIDDVRPVDAEIVFLDRIHPAERTGTGYVIKQMPGCEGGIPRCRPWTNPGITNAVVVTQRIPDLPPERMQNGMQLYDPTNPEDVRIRRLRTEWDFYEETLGREALHRANRRADLERALGVVPDLVPGSIEVSGADILIDPKYDRGGAFATGKLLGHAYVLTPVRYRQRLFVERRLAATAVAAVRVDAPGDIARLPFLSTDEKRAALAGQLWKGAPLFVAMLTRRYRLEHATLSLRGRRVSISFAVDGGTETFVDGMCETFANPPLRPAEYEDEGDE